MKEKIKNYLSILIIVVLLFEQISPVLAQEAPSAPTAPEAPSAPTPPPPPPDAPTAPEAPTAPTLEEVLAPDPEPEAEQTQENNEWEEEYSPETISQNEDEQTGINDSGNVGDTTIDTGDANSSGTLTTLGNTNTNSLGSGEDAGNSIGVVNSGNGTDSINNGSVSLSENNSTFQDNSAVVGNNLNQSSISGNNASNNNVGNTTINTGDANTTATVVTGVNTNVEGIMVSEFNIADDHVGDILLDFTTGCISGCPGTGSITTQNLGNGSDSTNNASVTDNSSEYTFQTNDAAVESNLTLNADSGDNSASANTNGDSKIDTGDANVAANLLNFVNNNLAGNIVFGVVNIFGDLIGDIILPQSALSCSTCGGGDVTVGNIGNGSDSTNDAAVSQNSSDNSFQYNDAAIENNLMLSAATGDNKTSGNTNGNSSIETGDTDINAHVLNIANSNVIGGDWWLVLVNEAGQWIGRILGAPDGQNFAGSTGTEFVVDENGDITAVNSGNGAGSSNTGNVTQNNSETSVQANNAVITNNLNLSANTGGNTSSNNTGGDSSIKTGDAKIVANIVNFVNNNVIGNGRLFVTVVNVFGSWLGDFVTPGQTQENNENPVVAANDSAQASNTNNGTGGSNSNSNSNSQQNNQQANIVTSGNNALVNTGSSNQIAFGESFHAGTTQTSVTVLSSAVGENQTAAASKKKLKINLAWALPLLPGFALIYLKRKFILKTLLLKKNS